MTKSVSEAISAPPALTEQGFQRLLQAAYILQCSDRRVREPETNARPFPVVPPMPRAGAVLGTDPHPFFPTHNWVIPPETARQLAIVASQLEALREPKMGNVSESTIQKSIPTAGEKHGEDQEIAVGFAEIPKGRTLEPAQFIPLPEPALMTGRSSRIFQRGELFWRTPIVLALAAVFFLVLGTWIHRLSPFAGRLALPAEEVRDQGPVLKTIVPLGSETKPAAPTVLPAKPPAPGKSSTREKSSQLASIHASETDSVAKKDTRVTADVQNRIRADRRLTMTRVQVRTSKGSVTLFGDVDDDAERMAAAQDAAQVEGVKVLINSLRVSATRKQSMESEKSASAVPVVQRAAIEIPSTVSSSGISSITQTSSELDPAVSKVSGVSTVSGVNSSSAPASTTSSITLPTGTVLSVRLAQALNSGVNQPGDTFVASLASPIVIDDRVVVPEGAGVKGKIVEARKAGRRGGGSALVIEVTHLACNGRTYELRSSQYSKEGASRNTYAAAAVSGGKGVGAVFGKVLGKGRGAAIGAVLGRAAGTSVQAVTKPAQAEFSAESTLSLRLERPLKVIPSPAPQQTQNADPNFSSGNHPSALKQRIDRVQDANTSGSSPTNRDSRQALSPPQPPHH